MAVQSGQNLEQGKCREQLGPRSGLFGTRPVRNPKLLTYPVGPIPPKGKNAKELDFFAWVGLWSTGLVHQVPKASVRGVLSSGYQANVGRRLTYPVGNVPPEAVTPLP